jgi:hypothetical protein
MAPGLISFFLELDGYFGARHSAAQFTDGCLDDAVDIDHASDLC